MVRPSIRDGHRVGLVITRIDLRGRTLTRRELLDELPRAEVDVEHAAEIVAPILDDVRKRGAAELRDLAERFDGVRPVHLRVPADVIAASVGALDPDVRAALDETIRARPRRSTRRSGRARRSPSRSYPVRRSASAGCRCDGWACTCPAASRSTRRRVVMNVVAAQEAGVGSLAVASPPQKNDGGLPDPVVLATCALLGVDEVYAVGGAQAVAMFAYGARGAATTSTARSCASPST